MSIYRNIYIKENRDCKLVINDVVGTDFALVEISFNGVFTRYRNVSFLMPSIDCQKFVKLLINKTQGQGSKGMDDFHNNKINSYEYSDNLLLNENKQNDIIKKDMLSRFKATPTDDLIEFKKRLATEFNYIEMILKDRGENGGSDVLFKRRYC